MTNKNAALLRRDPLLRAIMYRALVIREPRDGMAYALAQYWEKAARRG